MTIEYKEGEVILEKVIDWQTFKCRCSSIHSIVSNSKSNPVITEKQQVLLDDLDKKETLTDKQKEERTRLIQLKENSTKVILSDTAITYLLEEYAWRTQGMVRVTKELLDIPQMQKGTIVEPESLDLLSYVDKVKYEPNRDVNGQRERVYNEYLSGEVDAYVGNSIMEAEILPDVKSVWDYPTFLCKIKEPLTTPNDWQLKGYGDITNSPIIFVGNCLIDTPEEAVNGIKWKLLNKMHVATDEAPEFKEKWKIIERSMYFKHILPKLRVFKKPVDRMTDVQQQFVYDRVKICREWLNNFHEDYQKLNK
jgi:hypothetical protein